MIDQTEAPPGWVFNELGGLQRLDAIIFIGCERDNSKEPTNWRVMAFIQNDDDGMPMSKHPDEASAESAKFALARRISDWMKGHRKCGPVVVTDKMRQAGAEVMVVRINSKSNYEDDAEAVYLAMEAAR
jgi:hypothetical protein